MIILKGKYNRARVMLEKKDLELETKLQILEFLNNPCFEGSPISIMPDVHLGKGCCIGFTQKLGKYIIPNVIGVDIGCGVLSCNIGKVDINLKKLDDILRAKLPAGFAVHQTPVATFPIIDEIAKKIGKENKINYFRRSIGTLGGGNHFCEIGIDANNDKWITVHSGSRHFGLSIANYYQNKAKQSNKNNTSKNLEFLLTDSKEGQDYIKASKVANTYARLNRETILHIIIKELQSLKYNIEILDIVESIHNYISSDDRIIRKGAISAKQGERCIIPFNMQDGIIIGTGKGNTTWNESAPHGAGRVLSRKKARESIDIEDSISKMKDAGVYSSNIPIDEVAKVYKDKNMIIEMIKETVNIKNFIRPIYNFKA